MSFKPFTFNPLKDLGIEIPKAKREDALQAAAEYIKEQILEYVGSGASPVSGGKWTRSLTKGYAEKKSEESSVKYSNLELTGAFLDSLEVTAGSRNITVDVGKDQYGKAEAFVTGEFGSHSKKIRPRQFAPQKGETFKKSIMQGLKEILSEFEDGES